MPRSDSADDAAARQSGAPPTIDGMAFAREGGEVTGVAHADRLPRLLEMEADTGGLSFSVRGHLNALGRPALTVRVEGTVTLPCQRCLEPMECPVNIESELELREDIREIELADDDVDRALASQSMDVIALVEDEVLLVLPMSPRHEEIEVCEAEAGKSGSAESAGERSEPESRPNPFAALAARRQPKH